MAVRRCFFIHFYPKYQLPEVRSLLYINLYWSPVPRFIFKFMIFCNSYEIETKWNWNIYNAKGNITQPFNVFNYWMKTLTKLPRTDYYLIVVRWRIFNCKLYNSVNIHHLSTSSTSESLATGSCNDKEKIAYISHHLSPAYN